MWSVCVKDDTTQDNSLLHIYYEKDCVKSFDNILVIIQINIVKLTFQLKALISNGWVQILLTFRWAF